MGENQPVLEHKRAWTKCLSRGLLPCPARRAAVELVSLLDARTQKVELHPKASSVISLG